ncbi:MAG TPA: hypothetical protein ENK83_01600 [Aliiroseovarius sp.]|nr:hypothetical protein [Aliiroseovarius sp.]
MNDYSGARLMFFLLRILGVGIAIIGGIMALFWLSASWRYGLITAVSAAIPGLGMLVGGFIQIAVAQLANAVLDMACNSNEMLEIARKQAGGAPKPSADVVMDE